MTKKPTAVKKLPPLGERFEFVGEDVRAPGDLGVLRAPVVAVYDRVAQIDRGLRVWRKTGTPIDADLRKLWLHEMRQVRRLMASAGAPEVIVDLIELVEDVEEFGIVVQDCGQSLALMRSRAGPNHWLRNLRAARARALLWANVRRLARALGLVHGQGLIHGTLSANTVMTHGAPDADFRLTGFEWSLWFAAPANLPSHPELPAAALYRRQAYSFSADWRALGELAAELLGVRASPTGEVKATKGEDMDLSTPEIMLLRRLVHPGAAEALDGPTVTRAIDDIAAEIARSGAVRAGTFIVLIPDSCGLAKAAAQATDNAIESDQRRLQLEWAAADVAAGATLFVQPGTPGMSDRLTLVTDTMSYVLKGFTEPGGEASWDIAFCESASLRETEVVRGRRGAPHELVQPVNFVPSHREAREMRARLGAAVLDWSVFGGPAPADMSDGRREVRQALTLVQALEAFTKAMEILPVEVVSADREDGRRVVTLRAREDTRDAVAVPIGLAATDAALRRLFDDDGRQGDGNWLIGVSNRLDGGRSADVAAIFLDVIDAQGTTGYRFELDDNLPAGPSLFLRSKQEQGTGAVIRRRLRNIAAMADQPAVADMLEDPWLIRRTSRDILAEDDSFRDLDAPKQEAMRRIWSTLPLFAVVGPPGVGKTRLAREVVARRFQEEPSARLLLTAQGHHALDHLQGEVTEALTAIGRPDALIVRTTTERRLSEADGTRIRDEDEPEYDATRAKVSEMLAALSGSPLSASFPPPVRARLAAHARSAVDEDRDPEMRRSYQASADLLLDAANVVVSTTNSAAIGQMVAERANFDLVIVEEAAKATGPELVGALGLSGRQLLIGDHRQLPPFDADRMEKILSNDALVRKVIAGAPDLVGSFFADGELAELQRAVRDGPSFEKLKGLATRMVQPFRAIVEGDEQRAVPGGPSRRLSSILTEQRRMNPAIAELVSHAFYEGKLTTSAGTASSSPIGCMAPLPASPLVVVDFEHVSRTGRSAAAEFRVRGFHNPGEARAVLDVLRLLRALPGGATPTVAVLSPYREQVSRIRGSFEAARRQGLLPDFERFRPVRDAVGFFGTVDSFQGSEADVVVISLVRNNPRTGRSGLGFLSDPRRMNVLLSRAKSKLVLVGSMDFLREAVRGVDPGGEKGDLGFLATMLKVIGRLAKENSVDGNARAAVIRPESLECGA